MRRIALTLVVAVVASGAGTAAAGTTTQQQVTDLKAQVKALQASVKKLQTTVKKQEKKINLAIGITIIVGQCELALTADAFQGTWAYVDQLLVATGKPVVFGPQSPVNDFGACALFKNASIVHTIGAPPTAASFGALIQLLHG